MLRRSLWNPNLFLAAILLVALIFRFWGIAWGLHDADISRRPHPDEWPIYWLFQWFSTNRSLNPCPSGTQCFFDWGGVFPYLAYAFHFLASPFVSLISRHSFGSQADLTFVRPILETRILSAALSTLTVLVVYRMGLRAYGIGAGLIAALIMALAALPIQLGHFATPDSTTGLFMALSLLFILRAMQAPSMGNFALAGVFVGLSGGTEYNMVLLVIPLTVAWILNPYRQWKFLITSFGCVLAAFLISNPYVLVDFSNFRSAVEHTVGIHTVNAAAQYGDRWKPYDPGWLYVVRFPLGYGVGFALTILLLAGAAWSAIRHRKAELLLFSWIVPYALLVSFTSAKFMRYSAPLIPPLALMGGSFTVEFFNRYTARPVRMIAVAAACLALLFTTTYDAAYAGLFTSTDPRAVATDWLKNRAPARSEVSFEQLPNGLVNLPYFVTASGYQPCFTLFRQNSLTGPMSYVVTDNYDLEEHPGATSSQVHSFERSLSNSRHYQLVRQIFYTPTFLGLRFPIQASPHDWRYPDHEISIYRHLSNARGQGGNCFKNLNEAVAALYVAPSKRPL